MRISNPGTLPFAPSQEPRLSCRLFWRRSCCRFCLRRWFCWTILLLLHGLAAPVLSQPEPTKPRPKIGLALAGGSAKGFAHVGVLKWFEQHHVPIDSLSGTSMGGLIGACYCMGMTPEEMEALLKGVDWNKALRGEPEYRALPFRRKEDVEAVPSRIVIGLRGGVKLPDGFNSANPIGLLISRVSLPYSEITNFDDLPIPFRCMAVDMDKGEAIALKDGSLVTALRASMALPAIFTPVQRDGKLLTDGGTLDNIPTEALKDMGVDVVIAVDLSANLLEGKTPDSLIGILGRTVDITTYTNERRSLKLADIVISPELTGLSLADFNRLETFIKLGYQAAEARKNVLERFALSDADWLVYTTRRAARKRANAAPPTFIQTVGVTPTRSKEITQKLHAFVGAPLDDLHLDKFNDQLTTLTGEGRYESFLYERTRRDGLEGLLIRANEKKYSPPFLRIGAEVNGADTDNIRTNVVARLIDLDVGTPGAETRTDVRIGTDKNLAFEYYRPLTPMRRWFVAPRIFASDNSQVLYQNGARVADFGDRSVGLGLDVGVNTTRESELRLGYEFRNEDAYVRIGTPVFTKASGNVSVVSLRWAWNGQDSPFIPLRGNRARLNAEWYFDAPDSPNAFPRVEAHLSSFQPLSKQASLFGSLAAGTTFGNRTGLLQQFTAGGPTTLGAYGLNEFRGYDLLVTTAGVLRRAGELPSFLGGNVVVGSWLDFGGAFNSFEHAHYLGDVSVGFLAETLLGPVVLGYSYGEHGSNKFFFTLGRFF